MNLLRMLIMILIQPTKFSETIFYQNFADPVCPTSIEGWTFIDDVNHYFQSTFCQSCEKQQFGLLAGYGFYTTSRITSLFFLPPHFTFRIEFTLYMLSFRDSFEVTFNPSIEDYTVLDKFMGLSNICNFVGQIDNSANYNIMKAHQSNSLLTLFSFVQDPDFVVFWGLGDIKLFLERCPSNCIYCEANSTPEICQQYQIAYQSFTANNIASFQTTDWIFSDNTDPNIYVTECLNFPIFCGPDSCGEDRQFLINLNLPLHEKIKIQFKLFLFNEYQGLSIYLQLNEKLIFDQQFQAYAQVGKCIQGQKFSLLNIEVPWLVPFSYQIELKFTNNFSDRRSQSFGIRDFFVYISNNFQKVEKPTICGDGLKEETEECDDGNIYPFDGCFNCLYSCEISCLHCMKGICLQCNNDDEYGLAWQSCEIPSIPINCDDYCEVCIQGDCYRCQNQYTLENNKCKIKCGDGKVDEGLEECDDGNNIPFDGCYNCQYQCYADCINCNNGVCLDLNVNGYQFIDDSFQSVCGDGNIVGQEECDDGNTIQFDGCYDCYFQCPLNCLDCFEGICKQCKIGYQLDSSKNYCDIGYCGDGIVNPDYEQCDDENNISGDGCTSKCIIELNWLCYLRECSYEKYPELLVLWQKQDVEIQYLSIQFTQPVKTFLKDSFTQYIQLQIIGTEDYELKLHQIIEVEQTVRNVEYIVEVIFKATTGITYLQVNLLEQLYNINEAQLKSLQKIVKLKKYTYLGQNEVDTATTLKEIQQKTLYSQGGLEFLLILTSNYFSFLTSLQNVQETSYLKYINIYYPLNLEIFFGYTTFISISQLMSLTNIDMYFETLNFGYLQSQDKLKYYEVNAYLLYNLNPILFCFLVLIAYYILINQLTKVITAFENKNEIQQNNLFRFWVSIKFKLRLLKFKNKIRYKGLKNTIVLNFWDLCFFTAAQLKVINFTTFDFCLSSIISYISVMFILLFTGKNFIQTQGNKGLSQFYLHIKKPMFIVIIVFFQNQNMVQILLISLVNSFYLQSIIMLKASAKQKWQKRRTIFYQISILIFTLSSVLYLADEAQIKINKVNLGWMQIIMLTGVSIFMAFIDFIYVIQEMIRIINRLKHQRQLLRDFEMKQQS